MIRNTMSTSTDGRFFCTQPAKLRERVFDKLACPCFLYHGYESQFALRLTAGVGQFSASGRYAEEAENGRANSTGV